MKIICPHCNGRREYLGLGAVRKKCTPCQASGFIEEPEKIKELLVKEQPEIIRIEKKRGNNGNAKEKTRR